MKMKIFLFAGVLSLVAASTHALEVAELNPSDVAFVEKIAKTAALCATAASTVNFLGDKEEESLKKLAKFTDQIQAWATSSVEGGQSIMRLKRILDVCSKNKGKTAPTELGLIALIIIAKEIGHDVSENVLRKIFSGNRCVRRTVRVLTEALVEATIEAAKLVGTNVLKEKKDSLKGVQELFIREALANVIGSGLNEIGGEMIRLGLEEQAQDIQSGGLADVFQEAADIEEEDMATEVAPIEDAQMAIEVAPSEVVPTEQN